MPVITIVALAMLVTNIYIIVSSADVRDSAKKIGPQANLLLPGINPFLPVSYTLAALIISVFIHEAGHGVVARVYNMNCTIYRDCFCIIYSRRRICKYTKRRARKGASEGKECCIDGRTTK